ncbi:ADP-ribosylglycohydrolase family protein [Nocardioides sp. CN2-186]|uniref:ADP-ribosylglycohydrolase family protein n=1 Tax=Nocardioides tweenelious TaxID=3156607 RepID=UPI0032B43902
MSSAQTDRACGVLLGQACGDALGVPYEFARPPAAHEQAQMRGGGLGPYAPGEWSDDTQMAVGIAQVASSGADLSSPGALDEISEYFLRWRREGASDIGVQTSTVLSSAWSDEGSPSKRLRDASQRYAEQHPRSAGNGALMRTAIVGISALDDRDATAANARAVAELTHADPLASDSCVLWSEAIRIAVLDKRLDLRSGLDLLPADRRNQWGDWITDAETSAPSGFTPNGFTVTALQAAWSAIIQSDPANRNSKRQFDCEHLQDALHAAIRIGNDTDTIAAIGGGLLGAFWGQSAIPLAWVRQLHGWPGLRARDLVRLAALTATGGVPDRQGWPQLKHLEYGVPPRSAATLIADDEVLLGTANATGHDATALVSLCRLGTQDVPAPGIKAPDHVEVRLLDSDAPDANPNLGFVLANTAETIRDLRQEGHRVLVHCVRAEQRTPAVAVVFLKLMGFPVDEASAQVARALPDSRRVGRVWVAATNA